MVAVEVRQGTLAWMVVVEVRQGTLVVDGRGEDEEEEEDEEEKEEDEEDQATDIKSNNPHLAGGEKNMGMNDLSCANVSRRHKKAGAMLSIKIVQKLSKMATYVIIQSFGHNANPIGIGS